MLLSPADNLECFVEPGAQRTAHNCPHQTHDFFHQGRSISFIEQNYFYNHDYVHRELQKRRLERTPVKSMCACVNQDAIGEE